MVSFAKIYLQIQGCLLLTFFAEQQKKTKQNKTKRFLVCQPDDNNLAIKGQLNVLVYQFIVTLRVVVKSILKLSRGNWCLWLGEVRVNQPKRLGYYNISTTNLIVFSVLRRQSSRNRCGEQCLHGVTVENVSCPLNAVLYCCNFYCVGVKQPTSDQR